MIVMPINAPLMPLNQISPSPSNTIQDLGKQQTQKTEFTTFLNDALDKLNTLQIQADQATVQVATGEAQDIHNVMVALEKANLGFSLAVEVRNKVLDAYREVMRMQI